MTDLATSEAVASHPRSAMSPARLRDALASRAAFMRVLREYPPNRQVSMARSISPMICRIPEHIPGISTLERRVREGVFRRDIQRLHDALAATPMAGRYWVWGGALLGWAREGRILPHDQKDLDLAYDAADEERMQATLPVLRSAGFAPWFSFRNNSGQVTESTFVRHGAHFEFWRLERTGAEWEYFVYGTRQGVPTQRCGRLPVQPLETFDFLDRTWQKVVDHDRELTLLYGDWRTPDSSWSYIEAEGMQTSQRWRGGA